MKKGGAAKGELVLAMYELANSFQHGWGVDKDPAAARSYYETAANLGDTDAMNEVARCYEVGFGGKKDKVSGSLRSQVAPVIFEYDEAIGKPWARRKLLRSIYPIRELLHGLNFLISLRTCLVHLGHLEGKSLLGSNAVFCFL